MYSFLTPQNMGKENRKYIRHPSDIPIEYHFVDVAVAVHQKDRLRNISIGGLSFRANQHLEQGTTILIQIPVVSPKFKGEGIVVWCRKHEGHYDVGIQFLDEDTKFRARMVEQICHIEQYKRDVFEREGRQLSAEEAAAEWIRKYAQNFPA
jgi:hypothetical protein